MNREEGPQSRLLEFVRESGTSGIIDFLTLVLEGSIIVNSDWQIEHYNTKVTLRQKKSSNYFVQKSPLDVDTFLGWFPKGK